MFAKSPYGQSTAKPCLSGDSVVVQEAGVADDHAELSNVVEESGRFHSGVAECCGDRSPSKVRTNDPRSTSRDVTKQGFWVGGSSSTAAATISRPSISASSISGRMGGSSWSAHVEARSDASFRASTSSTEKPAPSSRPRTINPPSVFANAETVSTIDFGSPPAAALTSTVVRSVRAERSLGHSSMTYAARSGTQGSSNKLPAPHLTTRVWTSSS